jgi:hypothetical protein
VSRINSNTNSNTEITDKPSWRKETTSQPPSGGKYTFKNGVTGSS